MVVGEVYQNILEHLKREGSLNTFRLARDLNLDRSKLLKFIENLEKAGAVEVQHGVVRFLKFAVEEKRIESKVKESGQKAKALKIIRRTIVQKVPVIKKVYVKSKKLEEQAEQVVQLEKIIKELKKKAHAHPKIITKIVTRTIIKKVPVTKTVIKRIPVTRTVTKKVPAPTPHPQQKKRKKRKTKKLKKIKKKLKRKEEKKSKRIFKKFKFAFMKNIKQLKKPEFAKK